MRLGSLTGTEFGLRIEGYPDRCSEGELRDLLERHGVLLFPGFGADIRQLVRFAEQFGEPEPVFPQAHQVPGHPTVRLQSNVGGLGASAGGHYWHADGPLNDSPTAATVLHCVVPPDHGGDTLFADMRAAFAALPSDTRAQAANHRGYYPAKDIARRDIERACLMRTAIIPAAEKEAKIASLRNLYHPLVRRHLTTGEPALYLNEHWLASVEGLTEIEGNRLLWQLYRAATHEENLYRHSWTFGDLIVWDNALVMHKALPVRHGGRKVTHRITTSS